jgi:hypothetical protein
MKWASVRAAKVEVAGWGLDERHEHVADVFGVEDLGAVEALVSRPAVVVFPLRLAVSRCGRDPDGGGWTNAVTSRSWATTASSATRVASTGERLPSRTRRPARSR